LAESPADICKALLTLINSADTQDELECRKYLSHAEDFLFKKDTLRRVLYSERELPTNMGKSDYVVSGIIGNNPVVINCVRTYVWEFKAPQCSWFRKETENRLCPTKELFEAENQLLNYYHSLKFDLNLVKRFEAGHPDNVFMGGIIIGSRERLVMEDMEPAKKGKLLEDAYTIRNLYFYQQTGLSLFTWNDVLDHLNRKFVNYAKESTIPEYKFSADKIPPGTLSADVTVKPANL